MKKREIGLILLAILVAGYANFVTNHFSFEPFYSLYPDAVGLYNLHNLNDSGLFPKDLIAATSQDVFKTSPGLAVTAVLYRILLSIFPLPVAFKILSILICILCVFFMYKAGVYIHSERFAFLFSVLFLTYFSSMDTFYSGIGRNFGLLIFCLFFYFLSKEKFFVLPLFIPLAVVSYAYLSVIFSVVCFLLIVVFRKKPVDLKKYIILCALNVIGAFFLAGIDRAVSGAMANLSLIGINKYTQNLVSPIETFNPLHIILYFVFNLNEHGKLYTIYFSAFFIFSCLLFIFVRPKKALRFKKHIWIMLLGSALGFIMLYPFHPVSASRQFVFVTPLFLVFVFSLSVFAMDRGKTVSFVLPLLSVLSFVVLHPLFGDMTSYRRYKPIYDYVQGLPKDVLVAGYPSSMCIDSIPFFAKRANLFADHSYSCLHYVYPPDEVWQRRKDLLTALYSDSLSGVRVFISRYNIDYFILESRFNHRGFINVLDQSIALRDRDTYALIKNEHNFALFKFAEKNYDFKTVLPEGEIFIVAAKKIRGKD